MADEVRIKLSTAEQRALAKPVVGRGGYQTLLRRLQGQIQDGVLTASPADVERMRSGTCCPMDLAGFSSDWQPRLCGKPPSARSRVSDVGAAFLLPTRPWPADAVVLGEVKWAARTF